jgi:hypothetical protein
MLKIEYAFKSLLTENEERPHLVWWTSANKGWYKKSHLKKDGSAFRGDVTVQIQGDNTYLFKYDETIRVQCLSYAETSAKRPGAIKSGSGYFYLKEAIIGIIKKGSYEKRISLTLPTVETEEGPLLKGVLDIVVTVDKPQLAIINKLKFSDPTKYDLIKDNEEFLISIGYAYANRTRLAFDVKELTKLISGGDEAAKESRGFLDSYKFESLDPSIEIHVPLYLNEVFPLPIWAFFVDSNPTELTKEDFVLNLLQISLDRNGMTKEKFISSIDTQLGSNSEEISNDFLDAIVVISKACSILSTSLPYIMDETFTGKGKKQIIESFHYALRLLDGDCEDLGSLIHRVCREFRIGDPSLRDVKSEYTQHGGWHDPALQATQKILYYYVSICPLGSVTSAYLGENDEKKSAKLPIIIGSEQDRKVDVGFHIWNMGIPLEYVERCIKKTNASTFKRFEACLKNLKRYKWEVNLPVLVQEGTGDLFPLIRPLQDYYKTSNEKQLAVESIKDAISMMRLIYINPKSFKRSTVERKQGLLKDVENSRFSTFYREGTHCYTDYFFLWGLDFGEVTWITVGSDYEWRWGAHMRSMVMKSEHLGLLITPGCTEDEYQLVKTVHRHLPPMGPFKLDITEEKKREVKAAIEDLKSKINISNSNESNRKSGNLSIFFSYEFIKDPEFRKQLAIDISEIEEVIGLNMFPEFIKKGIINIRMEFTMLIPTEEKLRKIEELRKKKEESGEGNSSDDSGSDGD